jgi:hypothetical protein
MPRWKKIVARAIAKALPEIELELQKLRVARVEKGELDQIV